MLCALLQAHVDVSLNHVNPEVAHIHVSCGRCDLGDDQELGHAVGERFFGWPGRRVKCGSFMKNLLELAAEVVDPTAVVLRRCVVLNAPQEPVHLFIVEAKRVLPFRGRIHEKSNVSPKICSSSAPQKSFHISTTRKENDDTFMITKMARI